MSCKFSLIIVYAIILNVVFCLMIYELIGHDVIVYLESFVFVTYFSILYIDAKLEGECVHKWWSIGNAGKSSSPETWEDVFASASLSYDYDPIILSDKKTFTYNWSCFRPLINPVIFGLIICAVIPFFYSHPEAKNPVGSSFIPTASVQFIGFFVVGFFALHHIRAKVLADSRQAWINKVRELLASITVQIGCVLSGVNITNKARNELNEKRLLLEFHLNPSEKDHRLLMLLIRACVIPGEMIALDNNLRQIFFNRNELGCRPKNEFCFLSKNEFILLSSIICDQGVPRGQNNIETKKNVNDAISHIIKLSHVILKREWERVRLTR